jgi:hypothetical protein
VVVSPDKVKSPSRNDDVAWMRLASAKSMLSLTDATSPANEPAALDVGSSRSVLSGTTFPTDGRKWSKLDGVEKRSSFPMHREVRSQRFRRGVDGVVVRVGHTGDVGAEVVELDGLSSQHPDRAHEECNDASILGNGEKAHERK